MQLQSQPLPADRQQALSQWLDQPEFDTLLAVLEAGRFTIQVDAAVCREKPDGTGYAEKALLLDARARAIAETITLLQSVKNQKEPFTTVSAIP